MSARRQSHPARPLGLREELSRCGPARPADGRTPFLLDRSERCHLVAEGRVELFLVELRASRPGGTRTHLCTIDSGAMLFGVCEPDSLPATGFLAVTTVGTILVDVPLDDLGGTGWAASRRAAPGAAHSIDRC